MEHLNHGLAHDMHQRFAFETGRLEARRNNAHHTRPSFQPRPEPVMVKGRCDGDGARSHCRVHQQWCQRGAAPVLTHHGFAAHRNAWYSLQHIAHAHTHTISTPNSSNETYQHHDSKHSRFLKPDHCNIRSSATSLRPTCSAGVRDYENFNAACLKPPRLMSMSKLREPTTQPPPRPLIVSHQGGGNSLRLC